jgi:hypothetical protein
MKKIVLLLSIFTFIISCKKKKEPTPEPTTLIAVKQISVKIDGVEKSCNSCYSGSKSGNLRGTYFYLNGFDEQVYFSCSTLPAPGTYTLTKYGKPFLSYIINNSSRPAASGIMTISSIDTSLYGVVNKLVATFNFKTDTNNNGVSYTITEGSINLK